MVWLPSGDVLIAEREGGLRVLHEGKLVPKPVNGTPASFQNGVNGLKDVLLDPDYQRNQNLYILISEGTYQQKHAAVYRARYSAAGLVNVERIFRSKDDFGGAHSVAGRMLFLSDKTLLVGVPAATDDDKELAQQLDSDMGKIVRINRDGSIPPDNPFINTQGALPEIWSYGHRAPVGLYQDTETGAIWEVEDGPLGGDELNLLKVGGNFGWDKASWGFAYRGGGLAAPLQSGAGILDPVLIWMPSQDPSSITRYRGALYPLWDGDYFVGHLPTKELERLRINGDHVVLQEKMLRDLEERIRDVKVGPDNHIYILTDHRDGRVLRLQPGKPRMDQLTRVAHKLAPGDQNSDPSGNMSASLEPGDPEKGRQAFLERCAACHSVGTAIRGEDIGPDLAGVYGRKAGSNAGYNSYSAAMAGSPEVWDVRSLNMFLTDPRLYVPGTKMTAVPGTDLEMRRQIIGFLQQQSEKMENPDVGTPRTSPPPP
jgi:glucose/arabinose dehydrogenase/cytochrome c2